MSNVVQIRKPKAAAKSNRIKVQLDDLQLEALDQEAAKLHCSRSQVVRTLLAQNKNDETKICNRAK